MKEEFVKIVRISLLLMLIVALAIALQLVPNTLKVEADIGGGGGGGGGGPGPGQPWITIEQMSIDFNQLTNKDKITITEAKFNFPEGASYDLEIDDVTLMMDGVAIVIPAESFVKKGDKENYIFQSTKGLKPIVNMKLDFDNGKWSLKVSKIDASALDNRDGVDVTFSIGSTSTTEHMHMWTERLSYKAEP